jgi:hypothetical protein
MPEINTVKEHIAWSYANLAGGHNAVESGATKYGRLQYMIRARLFKGLVSGTMSMRSLYDDEKVKYKYPQSCCYCGANERLSMDHLISRNKGGPDHADNLVWACTPCNSSKRDRDLLVWLEAKNRIPSILMLRRYIKLISRYCTEHELLELPLAEACQLTLPFQLQNLPYKLENVGERVLWVEPASSTERLEVIES